MKQLALILAASALVGCATTSSEPQIEYVEVTNEPQSNQGVITIHRHGEGFDIWLTLDTSDENVALTMDLPNSNAEDETEVVTVTEEKVEQANEEIQLQAEKHLKIAQDYAVKGENWLALEEANKAVELVDNYAQAYALKGSVYYQLGLKDQAKAAWEVALTIDPELVEVQQSLDKLF